VGESRNLNWSDSRGSSTQFTPEKRLAVAILVDAVREISEHGTEYNEAWDWLMDRRGYREDAVFSADSVCAALRVDLQAVRTRLRRETAVNNAVRLQRLPVAYKVRPSYRERTRRTAP
jgi:hypothetical protein